MYWEFDVDIANGATIAPALLENRQCIGKLSKESECNEITWCIPENTGFDPNDLMPKEFGDQAAWCGMFRCLEVRNCECFDFTRGKGGQGVRGVIDPLDPTNAYGPDTNILSGISIKKGQKLPPANVSAAT